MEYINDFDGIDDPHTNTPALCVEKLMAAFNNDPLLARKAVSFCAAQIVANVKTLKDLPEGKLSKAEKALLMQHLHSEIKYMHIIAMGLKRIEFTNEQSEGDEKGDTNNLDDVI